MQDLKYKAFLKEYKLTDKAVGEFFGYSSPQSWHNSARRKKVIEGILKLVDRIKGETK